MSISRRLEEKFRKLPQTDSHVSGIWSQIRFTPDIVSNEQLAIGIIFNENGSSHTRFIEDFGRVKCAYGDEITQIITESINLIEDAFMFGLEKSFSSQIIYEKRGLARGQNLDQILNDLLLQAVPLSKLHDNKDISTNRFKPIKTNAFQNHIRSILKKDMGQEYHKIFPLQPIVEINDSKIKRKINIPIQLYNSKKIADMVSTVYSSHETIELNCLKAISNLEIARDHLKANNDTGLFILTPSDEQFNLLKIEEREKRQNYLNELEWRLQRKGITAVYSSSENIVANKILGWANFNKNMSSKLEV